MNKKLTTICRIGRYDKLLEETVLKSTEQLRRTVAPNTTIRTYAAFHAESEPYLLIVSQKLDISGPNTYLAIMSYTSEKNQEVAERFKIDTGIDLSEEREDLSKIITQLEAHFPQFGKDPQNYMQYLF